MNIERAKTFNRDNTKIEYRDFAITYFDHRNETRIVRHLTYNDAMQRARVLRARAYRDVRIVSNIATM